MKQRISGTDLSVSAFDTAEVQTLDAAAEEENIPEMDLISGTVEKES